MTMTGSPPRSSGRAPVARRTPRWGALVGLAVVALVVAGAIVVWASPVLGVRQVLVHGTVDPALTAQVRAAVDVDEGFPLARVDLVAVEQRVAAVDAVAAAHVERTWPDSLEVSIVARLPLATVSADGQWWSVAADGALFGPGLEQPPDLTVLELATPGEGDRATMAALAVLASLSPEVAALVAAVSAPTEYDVLLRLSDGREVLWGEDRFADDKNVVLPALLAQPGAAFDVTDPTLVTVR